jgi:formate hydrogenlyase subunit 4
MAIRVLGGAALVWVTWGIVAFLALNTLGNLSATHPVERWVMGSMTLVLAGLALFIALSRLDAT